MDTEKVAGNIVDRIIKDLTGRRGLRQEWDEIDDEIQEEIKARWISICQSVLTEDY